MNNIGISTKYNYGPVSFEKGKGASDKDVKLFANTVNTNAKSVSNGIVVAIKKEGIKDVSLVLKGDTYHIICGDLSENEEPVELIQGLNVNITITGSLSDTPAIISALDGFFANWYAVGGLLALGALYIGGRWLLRVEPRP